MLETEANIVSLAKTISRRSESALIIERISKRFDDLNMLPAVAAHALEIANNPECLIDDFVSTIERDAKLTADILGMANSPLYTYSASVLTLHQAVVRLGINRTRSVIFTSGMASVFRKLDLEEEWVREQLWMHSFMTAVVAWHLNKEFNCGFDGEEFTASILHDFGRLLFAVCLPERLEEIDPLDFDETPFVTRREQDITGVDHCELGAWFAVANRLPEELVEVVRLHHTPEEARVAPRLVALVAAADHLANHLQRNGGPAEYDCRSNTAIELLERSGIRGATDILSKRVEVIMTRAWDQGLQMLNF